MPVQHAIVLFPHLVEDERVEAMRQRFGPLASLLKAHITLVFPFEGATELPTLRGHIEEAIKGVAPFDITLDAPASAAPLIGRVDSIAVFRLETNTGHIVSTVPL